MWRVALVLCVLDVDARSLRKNTTSSTLVGEQAPILDLQAGNLVFDFGFFDGADSRSYLAAGFKVVAVEADPTLVHAARADSNMAKWISSGQLQLLNTAIAPAGSQPWTTFFMNKCTQEWNSFYSSIGCRSCLAPHTETPTACTAVPVTATTCAAVLMQYGAPKYFKLDIEGAESGCYNALSQIPKSGRPLFISGEVGDVKLIETYKGLGYQSFKLVQQKSGVTGAWGMKAADCRTGQLWRSYLGVKQDLATMLNGGPPSGGVCPDAKVGGVWYDLHASMQIPQAW